jgi:hypothetical protein
MSFLVTGLLRVIGITALSLVLVACSGVFVIKPTGRLGGPVIFHFYQAPEGSKPLRVKMTEFVVQEKSASSVWTTVWELQGMQDVNVIAYADKVDGLLEVVAASSLNPQSKYRVFAREKSVIGPPGYSTVHFAFDTAGNVVEFNP